MARKKKIIEVPEAVHIYHPGDNIVDISIELTGVPWMISKILIYSNLSINSLKDGDIIKWRL